MREIIDIDRIRMWLSKKACDGSLTEDDIRHAASSMRVVLMPERYVGYQDMLKITNVDIVFDITDAILDNVPMCLPQTLRYVKRLVM